MTELKPCPNCHCEKIILWHISYPEKFKYFAECDNCHWCGETKRFKFRAIRAWNRMVADGT